MGDWEFKDIAEGISLVLTSPTLWMGVGVVCLWREQAYKTFMSGRSGREAHEWLILGVCVAFLGSVADNTYWGITWTLEYIESDPYRQAFFQWGALPNIFFRQLAGIYAAHCHIMAFLTRRQDPFYISTYRTMVTLSLMFGVIWVLLASIF